MNIVHTILEKETLLPHDKINILWTQCDNSNFTKYIQKFGHNLYTYENLYFGNIIPHLIICNNKMYSHQQIKLVSLNYHLPILVVDHIPKDPAIDLDTALKTIDNFKCSLKIAINSNIYDSWNKHHDLILEPTEANRDQWKHTLYNLAKRIYTI